MMTVECMLPKRPVLRIAVDLFFSLTMMRLFKFSISCVVPFYAKISFQVGSKQAGRQV